MKSDTDLFDLHGHRKQMQYRLTSYDHEKLVWREIGYISDDKINLNYVVWPGHSIFGPMLAAREYLTIVVLTAEPFLYKRGPVQSEDDCVTDTCCLKLFTSDPARMVRIIDAFKSGQPIQNEDFEIYCCEGLVVDVLHLLSIELKFDFLMYFWNDVNCTGQNVCSSTRLVNDIVSGVADMMAGAVTITSDRLEYVEFTEAIYFASFHLVASSDDRVTTLLGFLNPFHYTVWITIIASASFVAVVGSLFEWKSPFGLNPWGKRRKKKYTLGSALTMVYSIWFGNTVNIKSPKSWPSKFLQNCWSALAIFVLASYTANLAAFLAGSAYSDTSFSILDSQVSVSLYIEQSYICVIPYAALAIVARRSL